MKNRTLALVGAGLLAGALVLGAVGTAMAQSTGPFGPGGMMGGGYGYGPGGMMGGGYGPGMMRGGYGPGGMMGTWPRTAATATPLAGIADAQKAFQAYVDRTGNADLTLDEVLQFQQNFYAEVKEKSTGTGAFELLADPRTGAVFPEFGPNMMWNTKYGHMPGWAQQSGQQTVTADQAKTDAQQWLGANQPGSTTETPDTFYGYYTLHIMKDGKVTGMLSVNAYTGQVWYHTWHGAFVASTEAS
jgi:hypothetical protein